VHEALAQVTEAEAGSRSSCLAWCACRRRDLTRRWRLSWRGRRTGRRPGAGWLRRRRFCRRATALTLDPHKARRAGTVRGVGSGPGWRVRGGPPNCCRSRMPRRPNGFQQARIELIEAELAYATIRAGDVPQLLLKAAQRLESIDVGLARTTYLQAITASMFTDEVTRGDRLQSSPRPPRVRRHRTGTPSATDLLP